VWWLTGDTKDWIDIRVVSTAFMGNPASELFKINSSVAVTIELVEQSCQLVIVKHATNSFKGLFELMGTNSSVTFQVEVFEKSFGSLSFVISTMSTLTDFFKNDRLDLSESWSGDD
jgi:hypothetical protein